jgi:serine/threonine-protein kinase
VLEIVRKARDRDYDEDSRRVRDQAEPMIVPLLTGDFGAIAARFPELEKLVLKTSSDEQAGRVVEFEHLAWSEMGTLERALPGVLSYLKRLPALTQDSSIGGRPQSFWTLRRTKQLTGAALAKTRDEWVRTYVERVAAAYAGDVWWYFYAGDVTTPDEARDALAALPRFTLSAYEGSVEPEWTMGNVLKLAGHNDEAEPHLRRSVSACFRWHELPAHQRASLALGEILEAKGDKAGACTSCLEVLAHWGSAKPRSVTADAARAHAKKLGCR